jgi:RNase P subunit RPR2
MDTHFLACSNCHEVVMKNVDSSTQKIRSKVLVIQNDVVFAVCKGCGVEIPIPLKVDLELAKSLIKNTTGPRLYLKS